MRPRHPSTHHVSAYHSGSKSEMYLVGCRMYEKGQSVEVVNHDACPTHFDTRDPIVLDAMGYRDESLIRRDGILFESVLFDPTARSLCYHRGVTDNRHPSVVEHKGRSDPEEQRFPLAYVEYAGACRLLS